MTGQNIDHLSIVIMLVCAVFALAYILTKLGA